MPDHTPEPWAYERGTVRDEIKNDDGALVCDWDHRGRSEEPSEANVARIVACINACEEIIDPLIFMPLAKSLVMAAIAPCGCEYVMTLAERCRRIMLNEDPER